MNSILPMTPGRAILTAHQLYLFLRDVEVDEDIFIQAVAPEIFSVARIENAASIRIADFIESQYSAIKPITTLLKERYAPDTNAGDGASK